MKRSFTILTAALALLAFLAFPMGMWGQTRTIQTASYGFESGDAGWTATTFVTNNTAITAHGGSKYGATNGSTADVKYNTIVESPQSLTCYYSKTTTNTNAGSKFHIQVSTNNSTWTTVASGLGMDQVTKGTWYELTADLSSYSNVYVRVRYEGTSAVRALDDITLTYDDGQSPSTDPVISFNPASIILDDVLVNNEASTTFTVSQSNLGAGITLTVDNGDLDIDNIDQDASPTQVTWTYTPTAAGAISATVTASSGETEQTLEISGIAIAPVEGYDVDFEYATNMYPNWTFDNMTTYQTGSITAHGGTYYGTTGGKSTASITTTSTVANPGTLTCYVSKQSSNTTSSTWYIQVSSNGSSWTEVESHSATSMGQGSWVEFSADLSSYTDVYVRVYYSGSTAIRNIDDLTLTTVTPSPAVATTTTITTPSGFNTDIHNGTSAGTLTATVTVTSDGSAVSGATVTWSSSNTSVATIDANGAVTLVAVGTTTISASYAGVEDQYRPSEGTYELTVTDSNAPGTENNPYTVAQARAAIDAGTGTQGVYATGIVTAIPTAWSTQYNNITFNFVDNAGDTDFLQAYRCVSGDGVDASTVAVGDIVVVYGNLTKYNSTYEFGSGCQLVYLTHPAVAVEAPTFSPVAGTYASSQTVSMSCTTSGASIYYTTDGTTPDANSTLYTTALTVSTTTTFKAIAIKDGVSSIVATATYHINSQANPYTVAQALAFNEYPANGIYVHGIVSTAPTSLSSGTLTYYISDNGEATNELEVYKGKDMGNVNFTSVDDIQVGDIVTVYGNVVIYGTTNPIKEFAQGNYLVSFERPAQQYNLTVTPSANVEIYTFVSDDPTQEGQAGAFTTQVYDGTTVGISVSAEEGYILTLIVDGTDVTSQLDETGWYEFTMPAHNVTVTATASLAPVVTSNTYTLATSIESGKQYIIVGKADSKYYAMGYNKGNNRHAVEITSDGATATVTIANTETNAHEFTISSLGGGYYSIMDATTSGGYLYAGSSSGNQLKTETTLDENHNGDWNITINAETGVASVVADQSSNRNVMQFNNSSLLFNCYASASQHSVFLYEKVETVTETDTLTIIGYGANNNRGGYHLIASPIGNVDPAAVTNLKSNTYDLYRFNQAATKEWENYKQNNFSLEVGRGYLYANSQTVDLIFTGEAYNSSGEVILSKTNDTTVDFQGWNLVGNPFAEKAYIADGRGFYTMNGEGTSLLPVTNGSIEAMEGIFVVANYDEEAITFTTTAPTNGGGKGLALNLSQGRGAVIDRAIVRFNESRELPKFQLFEDNAKLYIVQDGEEYAVVSAEAQGEMPVSFKAAENGTYTLSIATENMDMNYLHLVDNMTGMDIDLLQTPSYSFEARTTDYESRFKLVFAGATADTETFAFFSNGNWVINNEGEATLQVVDITGRILSSETVSGSFSKAINAASGVYMLRLINRDNVKVQKIVVR